MSIVAVRRALRIIVALTLLSLVGGCASGASLPAATPAVVGAANPTTLVLWYGWSGVPRQALTRLVDRYNQVHPEGRIFAQPMPLATMNSDLRTSAQSGSGPHMMLLPSGWIGGLAADQLIQPLDSLLLAADQQPLLPVTLGAAQSLDRAGARHLYGMPLTFDALALFYNKANVITPPTTTAELFALARGLSDSAANPPRWGLAVNLSVETTIGYLYAFDSRVFDQQGQLVLGTSGRAGAEKWLTWLASLSADQRLLARPYISVEVDRDLKNSQALMTFGWAHQLTEYRQLWADQLGVAALPKLSETDRLPLAYVQSDVLAINTRVSPAEQQIALSFMRFMTGTEAQGELRDAGMQPANQTISLEGDGIPMQAARMFRSQAASSQPLPNAPNSAALREEIWQMQRTVLEGRTLPADAVTEAETRLRSLLQP